MSILTANPGNRDMERSHHDLRPSLDKKMCFLSAAIREVRILFFPNLICIRPECTLGGGGGGGVEIRRRNCKHKKKF